MWINFLKIALRSIWREKLYSIINFLGLSIGLAALIVVFVFIRHEFSFDKFHENSERIYLVNHVVSMEGRDSFGSMSTAMGLAHELEQTIPEIEQSVRVAARNVAVKKDEFSFEEFIHLVDPEFFEVFSFKDIEGKTAFSFNDPASIVITESYRDKMFGDADVVGKSLFVKMGGEFDEYIIKAVLADPPSNSTWQFSILLPFENLYKVIPKRYDTAWGWYYPNTFILVQEGVSEADLLAKMHLMDAKVNTPESIARIGKITYEPQLIKEIHLNAKYSDLFVRTSKPVYSLMLLVIGILILTVAIVNYTTLSVGRSVARTKEVGIRKVVGAFAGQIRKQFLFESVILAFLSLPFAVLIARFTSDTILQMLISNVSFNLDSGLVISSIILAGLVGLVAGVYPSAVLANKKPQSIFKSYAVGQGGNKILKTLTAVQFIFSVLLLVLALGIASQLKFLENKELGYNGTDVLTLRTAMDSREETQQHYEQVKEKFRSIPEVDIVGACSNSFGFGWGKINYLDGEENRRICYANQVDEGFIDALGIQIIKGRNFSEEITSDKENAVLINKTYAEERGWDFPIGKRLPGQLSDYEVIGVVNDFHYASLHEKVQPLILVQNGTSIINNVESTEFFGRSFDVIIVKVSSKDMVSTLSKLEVIWQEISPDQPFVSWFIDDQYEWFYNLEITFGKIARIASILTLLIAGMGLFGLTALNVTRKTKEIGIRKVLGATSLQVLNLFLRDFVKLILIASLISWPIAYIALNQWLQSFAFKTAIGWSWFVLPTLCLLLMTAITVLIQTYKIANSNPVNSLKYE